MSKQRTQTSWRAVLLGLVLAATQTALPARASTTTPEREFAEAERDTPCERVVSLRGVYAQGGTDAFHERVAASALDSLDACPDSPDWRMGLFTAGSHLVAAHRPRAALEVYTTLLEREEREHIVGADDGAHLRLLAELQFRVAEAQLHAFEFDLALDVYSDLIERPAFRRANDEQIREWRMDAAINFALVHWHRGNARSAERGMRRVARLTDDPNLRDRATQTVAIWRKMRRNTRQAQGSPQTAVYVAPELAAR